ncbi:biotin--[acetyl-CoA-carboxylase] ligase [Maribacter sp. HTCC2170]|uniref:biotin--[acetyl-CoA-carboxylase] ligase n=1 Tax=Maribacter sp. (strain HTCC2170 / KCCM 42371) TaxID=313603 RepID=UPI00006B1B39|nr:biotin--[acetyl-CoA-carboxylase] ligase [Maribacter sp. HTCC2170]EAR00682.1 putative biotin--(acetyl-CoA carboxylase) synthetase [Maribacter sp. HTCC2170]
MQIIKLSATDSTNLYLKDLMGSHSLEDFTVVIANDQTMGRGQLGTIWDSEPGKNLTFSVLKKMSSVNFPNLFMLNICVSLAIYSALKKLNIPNLKVKWPNDILSGNAKICGILIENILAGNRIHASVIGIGLNVNQISFNDLPKVTSLKLSLGKSFDLEPVLNSITQELKLIFERCQLEGTLELEEEYTQLLFRKDKPSTFKSKEGEMFTGIIRGISKEGKLMVALEDEVSKEFNLKEITLLY